jgi:hypothetical protein
VRGNFRERLADIRWRQRHAHGGLRLRVRSTRAGKPEKTARYKVSQRHLLTFEQQWTDLASGRTLPKFVTEELHSYLDCGIPARGFAHLSVPTECGPVVRTAFSDRKYPFERAMH